MPGSHCPKAGTLLKYFEGFHLLVALNLTEAFKMDQNGTK